MFIKRFLIIVTLFLLSQFSYLTPAIAAGDLQPVTLQLKWFHQFQFAGYYAAQIQGFYEEAGFDVSISESNAELESVEEEVVSGRADFGIGSSRLLVKRAEGYPVVVLAVVLVTLSCSSRIRAQPSPPAASGFDSQKFGNWII